MLRSVIWFIAATVMALSLSASASAQRRPMVSIPISAGAVTIDGHIGADEWSDAVQITSLVSHTSALLADSQTVVYIKRDRKFLYCAARCMQPEGSIEIRGSEARDSDIYKGDDIELFFQPDLESEDRYQIIGNPAGVMFDARYPEGGSGWNCDLVYRAVTESDGWVGEFAIPLKDIALADMQDGREIGFFVARTKVHPTRTVSSWRRGRLHDYSSWGRMVFCDASAAVRLDTLSESASGIAGTLVSSDRAMNMQTVSVAVRVEVQGKPVMDSDSHISIPPNSSVRFDIPYEANYGLHTAVVEVFQCGQRIFLQSIPVRQTGRLSLYRVIGSGVIEVQIDTSSIELPEDTPLRLVLLDGEKQVLTQNVTVGPGRTSVKVDIDMSGIASRHSLSLPPACASHADRRDDGVCQQRDTTTSDTVLQQSGYTAGTYQLKVWAGSELVGSCVIDNPKDQSWFGLRTVTGADLKYATPINLSQRVVATADGERARYKIQATFSGKGAGFVLRSAGGRSVLLECQKYMVRGLYEGADRFSGKESIYMLDYHCGWGAEHQIKVLVDETLVNMYLDGVLVCIMDVKGLEQGRFGVCASSSLGTEYKSLKIGPLEDADCLVRRRPVRSLLKDGRIYEAQTAQQPVHTAKRIPSQHWTRAIDRAAGWIDHAIEKGSPKVPGMEHMAQYTYQCIHDMENRDAFYAYPAFHHSLIIEALLTLSEYRKDTGYVEEAVKLARWNIEHSTPETAVLPCLPFSTTINGRMGGNADGETVMLDKAAMMGRTYLTLYRITGEEDFRQAAVRVGQTLLSVQQADGRWQNRVEYQTGTVIQDYMSNQVFGIRLMDELYALTTDDRYARSSKRALEWTLENPVKTGRWVGFYEDVHPGTESVGNYETIRFARYLLEHRQASHDYLKIASELTDWVATSFAVTDRGRWSQIAEQTVCPFPMGGHTVNYCMLLLDMYEATGNTYYRDGAHSCLNAAFEIYAIGKDLANSWYSMDASMLSLGYDAARRLSLE